MIPDEAVEAAFGAFFANCDVDFDGGPAIKAALEAAAPFIAAQAWDEGHRTYVQREPSDCRCGAWNEGECGCGLYGTGKIITPNPYREATR